MNRKLKWLLMLSLAAIGVLWFIGGRLRAAQNESVSGEDRVAELEARIDALEDEIATLKQQMARLGFGSAEVLSFEALPAPPPAQNSRSPHLEREPAGEINGVPYYILPLNSDGQRR
jgi:uncharacterized small protein (DUF1192 family)